MLIQLSVMAFVSVSTFYLFSEAKSHDVNDSSFGTTANVNVFESTETARMVNWIGFNACIV